MELAALRGAMGEYTAGFDPTLVAAPDAARIVEDAAAIERMAAAVKSLAAARVAETEVWKRSGDRSAAHELARKTGTPLRHAIDAIETGRRLRELPATAEAARRGELSPQQASAIAQAASVAPDAEERLLETSRSGSLGELHNECARTKAAVCDLEERRRQIHERRSLRTWTDIEGVASLRLRDNPEVIAEIMAAVAPVRDALGRTARSEGRHEPLEAHAADALRQLVCRGDDHMPARRATTKVIARIDLDALLRGHPIEGESCEIAGYGPVAVSAVRDMIDTGDPFLAAVVTKGERVVGVAHPGRRARAHQQSALEWLYPTCAVEGCNSLTFLEVDHRYDWSKTRLTVLDLLDRLCRHHHDRKTKDGWALVHGRGKRAFVPPDDPRHPRHHPDHPPDGVARGPSTAA